MKIYKKICGLLILFIFVILGTLFPVNINKAIAEDGGITMSVTPTRNTDGIKVAVSVTWSINSGTAEGVRITLKDENGVEIKKEIVVLSGDKTQTGTLLFKASDLESSKKYKLTTEARQIARLQDQWKGITWNFNNLWSDGEDYIQGVKEKSLWELKILSIVDSYIPGKTDVFTDKTQTASNDEAVPVAAKINVPENNTVYKMLAPLGNITCMDWATPKDPKSKCIGNNIGEYLNFIFKFLIGLCAALAVIMLIISGITYMGDESVFGKTEAKSKMFSAILGLIIALGSYALLNTINPDLTGVKGLKIDAVSAEINAIEYLSSDSYTKITGQKVLSASEYDTMGRKVAKEMGIPFCAIRVILERESKGNPGAIGFDENVTNPGIPSRRAFVNSGKKFNGEIFTPSETLITKKDFVNQSKNEVQNTPGLGVDWRFSKGLGLTQITLFPTGYFDSGYTKNPPVLNKNYYPTLKNGLTPRDLLDPEKNLKAGAQIWKQSWVACKSDIYGAWVGYGGGPGKCSTSNAFLIKEATVRTEYYNGCSAEDKNI